MLPRINITCETCAKTHDVPRTNEIPSWVISMGCNWCPCCEYRAEDYYEEWYLPENEGDEPPPPTPTDDPNQLCMPFIFDEIGIKQHESHSVLQTTN